MSENKTTGLDVVNTYVKSLCTSREMFEHTIDNGNRLREKHRQTRDECLEQIHNIDRIITGIISGLFGFDPSSYVTLKAGDVEQTLPAEMFERMKREKSIRVSGE